MDTINFQKSLGHVSSKPNTCNTPCKYFKKGACKLGALCRFLHINPKDRVSTPETHEQSISKTICNQICKYGRRPFLHLVVLFGSDPHVSAYSHQVLEKILIHGIDVSIQKYLQQTSVGFRKREVVRTENLSEIICSSHADFLIVIGDRNMKNNSCQAKRKGKLIEMRVNEMISLIWKSWPQNPHKTLARIQNLTTMQNELLLSQYCGLRHGNARIQYLHTMANELKTWQFLTGPTSAEFVNKERQATGLSNLQLSSIRLHKQFKKCFELFDEIPVHQEDTELLRGCIMTLDYKPNSSRSPRHFISDTLKKHLKRVLFDMMKQTEANLDVLCHLEMEIWVQYITLHNESWVIDLDALNVCDGEKLSGLDGHFDTIGDSLTIAISEAGKSKTMDSSNLSTPLLRQSQTSQSQSPLSSTTSSTSIEGSTEFGMINNSIDILGTNSELKKSPNQCDQYLSLDDSSDCEIEQDEPEDNGRIVSDIMENPSVMESPDVGINFKKPSFPLPSNPYKILQKKPQNINIIGDPKNRFSITNSTIGSPVYSNEPQTSLSLFDMPLSLSLCEPKPRTNFSPVVGSPPHTTTPPTPIGPTLIPQISSPFSMVSLSLSCLPSMSHSIFMSPFIQPPCRNDSVSTCRTSDYEIISHIWGESQDVWKIFTQRQAHCPYSLA